MNPVSYSSLTPQELRWLEIGKQISSMELRDFPRCDKSYVDISRRGEVILINTLRGLTHIQRNLGDKLCAGTFFEQISELGCTMTGVTAYTIGEKIDEMEKQNEKKQAAKDYWSARRKRKNDDDNMTECAPSTSLEMIPVKEEEDLEDEDYSPIHEETTIITSEQTQLISKVLRYPRVIFCWGDFVRDCPAISKLPSPYVRETMTILESTGLISTLQGYNSEHLQMDTVFVKETRESHCHDIYVFGLTYDEYLRIHFIDQNIYRRPLCEQLICFDRAINITFDTLNKERLENIMSLAIIQMDSAIVTPDRVKVKNLKMIDDVFNRMQSDGLLIAVNTSHAHPKDWEFKIQLCGEDLDHRLKQYGLNSSYFYDAGLDNAMMMKDEEDFLANEIKPEAFI